MSLRIWQCLALMYRLCEDCLVLYPLSLVIRPCKTIDDSIPVTRDGHRVIKKTSQCTFIDLNCNLIMACMHQSWLIDIFMETIHPTEAHTAVPQNQPFVGSDIDQDEISILIK